MKKILGLMVVVINTAMAEWPVSTADGLQLFPMICSDQQGGALIGFADLRNRPLGPSYSHGYEIYFQHLDANMMRWNEDVAVSIPKGSEKHGHRLNGVICEGNLGEAISCWVNYHNLRPSGGDTTGIYAQKVANGLLQWDGDLIPGKQPVKITDKSTNPVSICSDGAGGCIITALLSDGKTIKAWGLDSDGDFYTTGNWGGNNGLPIRIGTTEAKNVKIVPDSASGAFIA
jgi:hypothetical protein